jgi:hypothetical protein
LCLSSFRAVVEGVGTVGIRGGKKYRVVWW